MESPIIEMAKPKSPQKSENRSELETDQQKAKEAYKASFDKLDLFIGRDIARYKEQLASGDFEDKEGDEEGSGEKRKEAFRVKLLRNMDKVEKMHKVIESGEDILLIQPEISVDYVYANPTMGALEHQESITINIEEKLQEFITLYQETNIDIPPDFEDQIREIWSRNTTEIQQSIEENGFDDILLVPANLNLVDLAEKMKMENGNFTGANFDNGGGFAGAKSIGIDKPRIILYHKKTLPEIQEKTGIDVHLDIKAGEAEKLFKQNPDQYLSTLEDFIVFERKNLKDSNKHFSKYAENSGVWLSGTKSGDRCVYSGWDSDGGLSVNADDADDSDFSLGVRPSRYFY